MGTTGIPGFFIAPFAFDGKGVGVGFWDHSRLSSKWLSICSDFLEQHGSSFDAHWRESLSHLRTRMTSQSGAAILTFDVSERIAESLLLLSGRSPAVDDEVARMWVDSLRRVDLVKVAAQSANPFEAVLLLKKRPLMVTVSWCDPNISADDKELVRELGLHLTGAFFDQQNPPEPAR